MTRVTGLQPTTPQLRRRQRPPLVRPGALLAGPRRAEASCWIMARGGRAKRKREPADGSLSRSPGACLGRFCLPCTLGQDWHRWATQTETEDGSWPRFRRRSPLTGRRRSVRASPSLSSHSCRTRPSCGHAAGARADGGESETGDRDRARNAVMV